MPPKSGNTIFGEDGSTYRLLQEIGKGGEGAVWSLDREPNLVAKFQYKDLSPDDFGKLAAMCRLKTARLENIAAWPLTLLKESKAGHPKGLLMRRISDSHSVNQLYSIKSRLRAFPEAQFPFLLHSAINTARAFATVHDAGQVVGDVNHSNLMISRNGTVAMIDCNSFQITDGAKTFLCGVGTPEFTPPELQGGSFATQRRTTQHDSFGVSILIFYLLFLGRHPFMGMYDPKANDMLSLEQAIGQYKFPYALSEQSPEVRLPPFVPRLADYPVQIGELFKRAFTKQMQQGRPTAHEWVNALGSLASATKQCSNNPNHHHFSGLDRCPWCRVEGVIGAAIFGVKLTTVRDEFFNIVAVWAQIEAIVPTAESLDEPSVKLLEAQFTPDPTLEGIIKRRRLFRSASILIFAFSSIVAVAELNPLIAILVIAGALFGSKKLWDQGGLSAKPFYERLDDATDAHKRAEEKFQQTATVPSAFGVEKQMLAAQKEALERLPTERAQRIRALDASREQRQRQHFLERFRVEDERIPNIGPKNKVILAAWGIEDAWDVDDQKISKIKGFGPVKREALVSWRKEKERLFRFEPAAPVDPRDIHVLEQEMLQKGASLRISLNNGSQVLRQTIGVWQAQRKQTFSTLTLAAAQLARARVDGAALRTF